jgi:hypothetical protein
MSLKEDVIAAINRNSAENGSNTPDFILGEYLVDCLRAYDRAVLARSRWYGLHNAPGGLLLHGEQIPVEVKT